MIPKGGKGFPIFVVPLAVGSQAPVLVSRVVYETLPPELCTLCVKAGTLLIFQWNICHRIPWACFFQVQVGRWIGNLHVME